MNSDDGLTSLAFQVVAALARTDRQLVLAESCTAGLVAASLGSVPGVSRHFCGSAVAYQEGTKVAWLDVSEAALAEFGAVSANIARALAEGVLEATPRADMAASVTGHLGPGAPAEQDGVVFVGVQTRGRPADVREFRLAAADLADVTAARATRQQAAARLMLEQVLRALD